jgi:glycosyltransferase involved in cell wall biosynthesis
VRIGIDARELAGRPTGVGRDLGGLLREWAAGERARAHEFVLYAPEPLGMALDGRRFPTRLVPGPAGTLWEQMHMPAVATRDHLDVFFAPGYTSPLFRKVPTVVAIHDISFAAHPEWFTMREGVRRRWVSRQAALQARAIVTISQFSKREIVERFGIPGSKVSVIPPGVTAPAVPPDVVHTDGNVLYVGSILNRRHLPHLIRAFAAVARTHHHASLDIVGDNRSYPREDLGSLIASDGLNGRVRWHAWIGERELGALYGGARAFVFLSEYEGLGLTPLEALSVNVPPLVADTAVARESCGDAALYVSLNDLDGAARGLEQLLFDEAVRGRILSAAPQALARYSWPRAARETLELLERSA